MNQYMVIERFKPGSLKSVYERFDQQSRLMPVGLNYIDSWISSDLTTCYQLMETEDEKLFDDWIAQWSDLVEFEVRKVITSAQARESTLDS